MEGSEQDLDMSGTSVNENTSSSVISNGFYVSLNH